MPTLSANPATFLAVAKAAQPGDAILLDAGAYPAFNVYQMAKAAPGVIVLPAPGAKVAIAGVNLNLSPGWTFRGVTLTPWTHNGCCFAAGDRSHLIACELHGDVTLPAGTDPNVAVSLRGGADSSIMNCDIHHLGNGIVHQGVTGLKIIENHIHDIRCDAIRGGGSSDVIVHGNRIEDLYPFPTDHPDGIQFLTAATTTPTRNVTITRNDLRQGKGGPFQGIFVGNEAKIPYEGLTITGNLVMGGMWQGINVGQATAPVVENNYVGGHQGALDAHGKTMQPGVNVNLSTGGSVANNFSAGGFAFPGSTGISLANNQAIPLASPGDYTAADDWRLKALPLWVK